jgi:hypothetical protein
VIFTGEEVPWRTQQRSSDDKPRNAIPFTTVARYEAQATLSGFLQSYIPVFVELPEDESRFETMTLPDYP